MLDRRTLLKSIAATGIGTAVFQRAAAQEGEDKGLTVDSIKNAEWISGVELTDEQREEILSSVKSTKRNLESLRGYTLEHTTAPAIHMQTLAPRQAPAVVRRGMGPTDWTAPELPEEDEDIAFLPVTELSALIRAKKITSTRLTQIYLARLKKFGPMLRCVVTLTEELALEQAAQADKEISAGRYRGPLHGIPWGAKDLIAVPGYPTTWGIPHYETRELKEKATVAARLESAGAVLVAKLSLGALAMGDMWFRGMTRCPWDARVGSSGSSAGSASASVAGLVGFSIGSETLGSIISPSRRCGASGFRPTFGRVSRFGCMPLSWSMDKIGPLCRSIEDCALVFGAIHGADGLDPTIQDLDFQWPVRLEPQTLKIGYSKTRRDIKDRSDLRVLRDMGCELVEVTLPTDVPVRALTTIIDVEGASVFDQLLRDGHTDGWNAWDRIFRSAQYVSAVDYLRYQRVRTDLMNLSLIHI